MMVLCSHSHGLRKQVAYALFGLALVFLLWQGYILQKRLKDDRVRRVQAGFWEKVVLETDSAIMAVEADTSLIVDWNEGATRMLGWKAHEVVGSKFDFLLPEELRAQHAVLMLDPMIRNKLSHNVAVLNCWVHTKQGDPKPVRVRVRCVYIGRYYYIITLDEQDSIIHLPDYPVQPPGAGPTPQLLIPPERVPELLPSPAEVDRPREKS